MPLKKSESPQLPEAQSKEARCVLKVRVQAKASKNLVEGYVGDTFRLQVTAPPETGKANAAVIALLAAALDINRSRLTIIKGTRSRDKIVGVESLTLKEAGQRLTSATQ